MTLLWICAVQTTVILLIAVSVLPLLRKRSAALRHFVLAAALVFSAATPAFNLLMPSWSVPVSLARIIQRPQEAMPWRDKHTAAVPSEVRSEVVPSSVSQAETRFTTHQFAIAGISIWAAGVSLGLAFLIIGLNRLRRLASISSPIAGIWKELSEQISSDYGLPRSVRLLHSHNPSVLVTWGVARPEVLLPRGADVWPKEIANVVLRHELAHIRRRDWVVQMLAQSLRIVYWFNPLLWIVCRRLRLEAELACDDAVLVRDIIGHEYANHLLGLARTLNATDRAWSAVLTMARPSTLERRFAAMLNPHVNRNPVTRVAVLVTLLTGLCITASLPAMKTFAAAEPPPAPVAQARAQTVQPLPAVVAPAPQAQLPPVGPRSSRLPEDLSKLIEAAELQAAETVKVPPGTINPDGFTVFGLPFQAFSDQGMSKESAEMLINLFDSSKEPEMKMYILDHLGMSKNAQAAEKVLAIARSSADKDLQMHAVDYLAFGPNAFDGLVSIYDASRDSDLKQHILQYIGMSRDPRVGKKLFSIAQSDPDPELRRQAITFIAMR
jgi:beta-lactamase regulating signal transducer with metallopeptidase domain